MLELDQFLSKLISPTALNWFGTGMHGLTIKAIGQVQAGLLTLPEHKRYF